MVLHGITFDIKLCFTCGKKNLYQNVVKFQNIMARFAVTLLHYFVSSNLLLPALFVLNQVDPIPPLRNYTCRFCLFCDITVFLISPFEPTLKSFVNTINMLSLTKLSYKYIINC